METTVPEVPVATTVATETQPKPSKPKPKKKYIKSTVTVHDRTQIETVFDYYLFRGPKREGQEVDKLTYKVDAFLFYPRQFGLDATTYPKERFFGDIRPLLRFREPKLGYKSMLGQKAGATSPLLYLKDYVSGLEAGRSLEPVNNAVDEVRLFACAFVSAFLRGIDRSRRRLTRLRAAAAPDHELLAKSFGRMTSLIERANRVLEEYRGVMLAAERLPPEVGGTLAAELKLIDEYCFYRLRDGIAYLMLMSEDFRSSWPGPEALEFAGRVRQALAFHDDHAERHAYFRITATSSEAEKERFIHRRGELKRRIWAVLFLEIRTLPLFAVQRQIGAMIAAGVAAVWATLAQLLMIRQVIHPNDVADIWGIGGFLFLTAGALAYIIKDRIKEFGRSYFGRGVFRRVPDHSERIYYQNREGDPIGVGWIKETAKFLRAGELPPRLEQVRSQVQSAGSCQGEAIDHVMQYTKEITLSGKLRILNRYPLRAVHDILRLNIDACLPRLGEPSRFLNVIGADGGVEAVQFPKVYYLDMVLSYSKQDPSGKSAEQALDYFRLVVDKNGLLRIERLS